MEQISIRYCPSRALMGAGHKVRLEILRKAELNMVNKRLNRPARIVEQEI